MDNLREIMEWYAQAGVDVLLEDAPVNRFTEVPPPPRVKKPQTSNASPAEFLAKQNATRQATAQNPASSQALSTPSATIPDSAAIESARELAKSAETIDDLKQTLNRFEGCNLKRTAKSLVFSDGNPDARVMVVGGVPERDDDIHGVPFSGRSGQLFDRMLSAIGLDRTSVYISNTIPWRPPGNRKPTPQEIEICRPFIERHMELVKPDIIVLFDDLSAKTVLKTTNGIMKLRGKWGEFKTENLTIPALPTLHPSYLLTQPAHKALAWQDLLQVKMKLDG